MPVEPVVTPDKEPTEASPKQEPATTNDLPPPPQVPEQTEVRARPVHERKQPSYLQFVPIDVNCVIKEMDNAHC